ncbi:acyltransferase [Vibrio ostreicida]|nr:acyltransferase [Vibrio ostreicida]
MISLRLKLRNKFKITGKHNISIDPSANIKGCRLTIKGSGNHIEIGKNVNLRDSHIEIDGNNCTLIIGHNSVIGHNCYLSSRENNTTLRIGEGCMFSRNIKIMTSDGHNILKNGQRINPAKGISIGNRVWLADNVTVLKGVEIGESAIVGINSTLTKSIASGVIAAGNPAKEVQNNVLWQHELTY